MSLIERLKTAPIHSPLYHYTSQAGLLGILEHNSLWATAAQYLNDSSEYSYGIQLIAEELDKRSAVSKNGDERNKLAGISGNLTSLFPGVCVASLTEDGDLLSQWRAYSGSPGGFAIGFRAEQLRRSAHDQSFYLSKCIYRREDQLAEIGELIEEFCECIANSKAWGTKDQGGCVATATRLAVLLKHQSFQEEREWRLISIPQMMIHLDFRPGNSMLIPFFKFKLGKHPNDYLESVMVGPTPHAELSVQSAGMFLGKLNVDNFMKKVSKTRMPYRNW